MKLYTLFVNLLSGGEMSLATTICEEQKYFPFLVPSSAPLFAYLQAEESFSFGGKPGEIGRVETRRLHFAGTNSDSSNSGNQ